MLINCFIVKDSFLISFQFITNIVIKEGFKNKETWTEEYLSNDMKHRVEDIHIF